MIRPTRVSGRRLFAMWAIGALAYVAFWSFVAFQASQRRTAGSDLERRGAYVLTVTSMLDAILVLVAAPLAALESFSWSSTRGRQIRPDDAHPSADLWQRLRRPVILASLAMAASATLPLVVAASSSRVSAMDVVATRAVLMCTAFGSIALAALASAVWSDVHDAAGATYLLLIFAVGGVVFAGPLVARLADAAVVIDAVLLINPLVALASATNFDLLRVEALYRATPIAQRLFEYPSWHTVSVVYAAFGVMCVGATVWVRSREDRCV